METSEAHPPTAQTFSFSDRAMECPHCHAPLSLREAIVILNGSGYTQMAKIRLPDGFTRYAEAGSVNPNECEILDEPALRAPSGHGSAVTAQR
jgi:hypothetical protein